MKKGTLKQSLILMIFGTCNLLLALFIPKLTDSFFISVITLIPILTVTTGCFLQVGYDLLKIAYKQIIRKRHS